MMLMTKVKTGLGLIVLLDFEGFGHERYWDKNIENISQVVLSSSAAGNLAKTLSALCYFTKSKAIHNIMIPRPYNNKR